MSQSKHTMTLEFVINNLINLHPFAKLMEYVADGWRIKSVARDGEIITYTLEK